MLKTCKQNSSVMIRFENLLRHFGSENVSGPSRNGIGIDHFTVVCPMTWPLNGSEAGVDLVLIQTSLLLLCKTCSNAK